MIVEDLTIGRTLAAARIKRDFNLLDAAHYTKIPVKIIQALEEDDYSVFSSSTYARSFLAQYAAFLEIDSLPWLSAFEPAAFQNQYHEMQVIDEINEPTETRQYNAITAAPHTSYVKGMMQTFVLLLITGALLFAGIYLLKKLDLQANQPVVKTTQEEKTPTITPTVKPMEKKPEAIKVVTQAKPNSPDGASSIGNITAPPPVEILPEVPLKAIQVTDE